MGRRQAGACGDAGVFAMFGSTVLVPALTGLDASVTLLCMGVGTLIFHLMTKGIVPAFMGSSFSFITAICAVMTKTGGNAAYVGWGIMASGLLYLLLSGLVRFFGVKKITNFFPPVVTGCVIIIIGMMLAPISIVTFVEHVGDITANGAVTGHNYLEEPGLDRTLLGCGLATIVSGMMGGPAATTYSENIGVLAATKNYNPATLRIAAVVAILLAFAGKVSGLLQSIPLPVMGGVSVILFGMISSVDLRMLIENKVDFTRSYNLVIAGVMMVFGLGLSSGITIGSVTSSGTAIAAVLGIILSKVLPKKDVDERREEKKAGEKPAEGEAL